MRVAVLVATSSLEPWASFHEVQKQTWLTSLPEEWKYWSYSQGGGVRLSAHWASKLRRALRFTRFGALQRTVDRYSLRATAPLMRESRNHWTWELPETFDYMGFALLRSLSKLLEEYPHADFILRVNSSTVVFPDRLARWLERNVETQYAGNIVNGEHFWGFNFVNGAGILISSGFAREVICREGAWPHYFLDDVALGKVGLELGILPTPMPSAFVESTKDFRDYDAEIREATFIRVKSPLAERQDVKLMEQAWSLGSP